MTLKIIASACVLSVVVGMIVLGVRMWSKSTASAPVLALLDVKATNNASQLDNYQKSLSTVQTVSLETSHPEIQPRTLETSQPEELPDHVFETSQPDELPNYVTTGSACVRINEFLKKDIPREKRYAFAEFASLCHVDAQSKTFADIHWRKIICINRKLDGFIKQHSKISNVTVCPYAHPTFQTAPSPHMQNETCPSTGLGWVERRIEANPTQWPIVNTTYAVCLVRKNSYHAYAFQHVVEILFPCWSWFQMNLHAKHLVCDQYVDNKGSDWKGALSYGLGHHRHHKFTTGLVDIFRQAGAKILPWPCHLPKDVAAQSTLSSFRIYELKKQDMFKRVWFVSPKHAASMAAHALKLTPQDNHFAATPRVAFLNRRGIRRSVSNVNEILGHMRKHWQTELGHMENKSFIQQISWIHRQDVLVSPHGAQSTSIVFMPTCGAFLEFHTKFGEKLWDYGGLAADSGLISAYLYLSRRSIAMDMLCSALKSSDALVVNRWVRENKVCVPPLAVVDAVTALIGRRNVCIKEALSRRSRSAE